MRPGGVYLRARLKDEPERLYERIPDAFAALESEGHRDAIRPGIEHYRRLDEADSSSRSLRHAHPGNDWDVGSPPDPSRPARTIEKDAFTAPVHHPPPHG